MDRSGLDLETAIGQHRRVLPVQTSGVVRNVARSPIQARDGHDWGWVPGARNRVNRGGGFNNEAENARSGQRNANEPENRNDTNGLRVANASPGQIARVRHPRAVPLDAQTRLPHRPSSGRRERARRVW